MKRLYGFLLALVVASVFQIGSVQAVVYPPTLNGDPNWVLVFGRMDAGQYLNLNSLKELKAGDPYYVLSAEVVYAAYTYNQINGSYDWQNYKLGKKYQAIVVYDVATRTIAINNGKNWQEIDDYSGPGYITNGTVDLAQRMFWEVYHRKFFNSSYPLGGVE